MDGQQHGDQLKRGLKNRHIQLIALGGAIGTGLFLGIAQTIKWPARQCSSATPSAASSRF